MNSVLRSNPVQSHQTVNYGFSTMLGPVRPTQYDLSFSLFGIPVRVVPTFWLLAVLLGWNSTMHDPKQGFALMLIWIAVVFVSILVHELGHALTATLFGYPPRIMLYHFGGLAMYEPVHGYTAGKAILITLAGPGAGFFLFGITVVVALLFRVPVLDPTSLAGHTVQMLVWVNLVWSVLNLLPVLPLDGGQVCREICSSVSPYSGILWALRIGIAVGALIGVGLLALHMVWGGVMFLLLAAQNYQEYERRKSW
jgi:Zn-dependent protease